jgi:hypothetical protein
MLWMMGNKSKYAPLIGIACQILWAIYAIWLQQYGLLISAFAYTGVHIRNYIKWKNI